MLCPFPHSSSQASGRLRTRRGESLTIFAVGASRGKSHDHLRACRTCYLSRAAPFKRGFIYNHLFFHIHHFPMPCPSRMGTEVQEVGDMVYLPTQVDIDLLSPVK